MSEEWRWVPVSAIEREMKKWNQSDRVKISEVADRVATGNAFPRDAPHGGGQIWELRVTGLAGEYRIYFAKVKTVRVMLALRGAHKQWRKARSSDLDVAEQRLAEWRSQQAAD